MVGERSTDLTRLSRSKRQGCSQGVVEISEFRSAGLSCVLVMAMFVAMEMVSVPINKARQSLCELIRSGRVVQITSRGRPVAKLVPEQAGGKPWRMAKFDREGETGDLSNPVWDNWE